MLVLLLNIIPSIESPPVGLQWLAPRLLVYIAGVKANNAKQQKPLPSHLSLLIPSLNFKPSMIGLLFIRPISQARRLLPPSDINSEAWFVYTFTPNASQQ